MSKKAIFITFISTTTIVFFVGLLSYFVWTNQPSADTNTPPVPGVPIRPASAPKDYPPVPPAPRISGDTIDDGLVDALDINSLVVHWKEINSEYNLVDETSGQKFLISSLDLSQVIKYWKCLETRKDKECPYTNTPGIYPIEASSSATPTPTASKTADVETPPVPAVPTR